MKVKSESEVSQSWPTLRDPMDCSLPGSSIHGSFPGKSTRVGCRCLLPSLCGREESAAPQSKGSEITCPGRRECHLSSSNGQWLNCRACDSTYTQEGSRGPHSTPDSWWLNLYASPHPQCPYFWRRESGKTSSLRKVDQFADIHQLLMESKYCKCWWFMGWGCNVKEKNTEWSKI